MSHQEHQQRAASEAPRRIDCAVITISDTRSIEDDSSGKLIGTLLRQAGHDVVRYELVRDEPAQIGALVRAITASGCKLIITNGGTGITRRDSTFETIDAMLDRRIPGFGELFRMLSYQEIGAAAMLSRASAGLIGEICIFCLPGSTAAVRLALEKLILPELAHLIWETIRQ